MRGNLRHAAFGRGGRTAPRFGAALVVAAAAAAFTAGPALAHANLVRSVPAYGDTFSSPPSSIRLGFDEEVSKRLSRVTVVGARTGIVRDARLVSAGGSQLVAKLPRLPDDLYRIDWRAVATNDLHPTIGAIVFGVGAKAPVPPPKAEEPRSPSASLIEVVLHWVDFAAVAMVIGALAMLLHVLPVAARRGARRVGDAAGRLAWLALAGCIAALVSGVGLLIVQIDRAAGATSIGDVLAHTGYGKAWIAREVVLGVLACVLVALRRSPSVRGLRIAAATLGIGLVVPLALASHAASVKGRWSVATAVLGVHILAAALWVGGVVALGFASFVLLRAGERADARTLARSFGGLAALAVALIGISGIATLGIHVRSLHALLTTGYGTAVMTKTGLFLFAGAIGLATTAGLRARRAPTRLRSAWLRAPRLEAAVLVAALLPAAFLVASAPPRSATAKVVANPTTAPARSAGQVRDLIFDFSLEPNRPGRNFVSVGVYNVRRPVLAPIREVDVSISRPGTTPQIVALHAVAGERWRTAIDTVTRPGTWSMKIVVHRPGLPDTSYTTAWGVPASFLVPEERGLERPLEPILRPVAIAAAVLLGLILVLVRLRGTLLRPRPGERRRQLRPGEVER